MGRAKSRSKSEKHKVSFDEAKTVFDDLLFVIFADPGHSVEENRFVIMGESDQNSLLAVSYTERPRATRLISARKATRAERKKYEEDI